MSRKKKEFPGLGRTLLIVLLHRSLLVRGIRCIGTIFSRFFFFQFRSALFPRLPVSQVDHVLDARIPFNPRFIRIYLDFTAFWVRIVGFLCIHFGKPGRTHAAEFIVSITDLYHFAFQIYRKNLSTTERPNYKKNPYFWLIHSVDPHLMCIPSLHIMLMIHSYTAFNHYLRSLGEEETLKYLAEKVFLGAVVISEAVLYVKQHSINCIAAALYTMYCFDPALFETADAETFVNSLFSAKDIPPEYAPYYTEPLADPKDIADLRKQILCLYKSFLEKQNGHWTSPIMDFLKTML